ncbi:DUF664 domain-containing protein [Streptomyces sp. UH6]|nr:DUF664 domain-containing protein [Streptomyces sp. UH6]
MTPASPSTLTETSGHAGHADILREQLDGSTGTTARHAAPAPRRGLLGSPARADRASRRSSRDR